MDDVRLVRGELADLDYAWLPDERILVVDSRFSPEQVSDIYDSIMG